MVTRPAESASTIAQATSAQATSGTQADCTTDTVVPVIGFHRKGDGYPDCPFEVKDSPLEFQIRYADEVEARDAGIKRLADIDRWVEQLRLWAAVDRRVEQLRQQGGLVMEQLVHGSAWTPEPETERQQHEDEDDGEGHQANRDPGPEAR